jgi:hypothetical protein
MRQTHLLMMVVPRGKKNPFVDFFLQRLCIPYGNLRKKKKKENSFFFFFLFSTAWCFKKVVHVVLEIARYTRTHTKEEMISTHTYIHKSLFLKEVTYVHVAKSLVVSWEQTKLGSKEKEMKKRKWKGNIPFHFFWIFFLPAYYIFSLLLVLIS